MSIDYDKLRRELGEMEAGAHVTTRHTWADLAHELLHLRGVVEKFDNWLTVSAKNATTPATKNMCLDVQYVLTQLLEGDTE